MNDRTSTIESLQKRAEAPTPTSAAIVMPGFGSMQSFDLMKAQARVLARSSLVPKAYQQYVEEKDQYGKGTGKWTEQPGALENCAIALNVATRMGSDVLMVMQNLHIIEGRPSWSSPYIIAAINSCGKFSPLRFIVTDLGEKTVEVPRMEWSKEAKRKVQNGVDKYKIQDKKYMAWVIEKATGERLESPEVTIEMAVLEGWYTKNGSKWKTIPDLMGRYRTAAFFGRLYAPELLMGLPTAEESAESVELQQQSDGSYAPAEQPSAKTVDEVRAGPAANPAAETIEGQATEVRQPEDKPKTEAKAANPEPASASGAPGPQEFFQEAMAAIRKGDLDLARDIARNLPDGMRVQIANAIANAEGEDDGFGSVE